MDREATSQNATGNAGLRGYLRSGDVREPARDASLREGEVSHAAEARHDQPDLALDLLVETQVQVLKLL